MVTVVASDLHLGAAACQVQAIDHFLDTLPAETSRLVLNGDVLDHTERRLAKPHWRILSRLRKLSDGLELVWVRGNHDHDADAVAHLVGARRFVDEYRFKSRDRWVLVVHGDQWDKFMTDHPVISNVADWFYGRLQRLSRKVAVRAKRSSKTFLRCAERVRWKAAEYGRLLRADVVTCGHTHHAERCLNAGTTLPMYFNTGCWTDHHCHYLTVEDGVALLHEIDVGSIPKEET